MICEIANCLRSSAVAIDRPLIEAGDAAVKVLQLIDLDADAVGFVVDIKSIVDHEASNERRWITSETEVSTEKETIGGLPQIIRERFDDVLALEDLSVGERARIALPDVQVLLEVRPSVVLHFRPHFFGEVRVFVVVYLADVSSRWGRFNKALCGRVVC